MAKKSKMLSLLAAVKPEEEIKAISLGFMPSITDKNSQASKSELYFNTQEIDDEIFGNSGVRSLSTVIQINRQILLQIFSR